MGTKDLEHRAKLQVKLMKTLGATVAPVECAIRSMRLTDASQPTFTQMLLGTHAHLDLTCHTMQEDV